MTYEKWQKNGPDLQKLAQKKNQIGENDGEKKKNPSANPVMSIFYFLSQL